MLQKLYSILLSPFRRHVYDFENAQLQNKVTIDGDRKALLWFTVKCKYCGKQISVTRQTYLALGNNFFIATRFCVRNPVIFAKWQEDRIERREYLKGAATEDQEQIDFSVEH